MIEQSRKPINTLNTLDITERFDSYESFPSIETWVRFWHQSNISDPPNLIMLSQLNFLTFHDSFVQQPGTLRRNYLLSGYQKWVGLSQDVSQDVPGIMWHQHTMSLVMLIITEKLIRVKHTKYNY